MNDKYDKWLKKKKDKIEIEKKDYITRLICSFIYYIQTLYY